MLSTSVISVSPSFTAHSSNNLADIADRVVQEFRNQNGDDDIYEDLITDDDNQFYVPAGDQKLKENESDEDGEFEFDDNQFHVPAGDQKLKENESDSDEEFEFDVVRTQSNSSPVSADEIFSNGEIRYPLFDRSLLLDDDVSSFHKVSDNSDSNNSNPSPVKRVPLRKLFNEERESASCSSSEADDLDGITPGTYCIWKPKAESPERCKKSNSTGNTSKRWKFVRNLLHRSNSDNNFSSGKDASVVVLNPVTATKNRGEKVKKVEKTSKVAVADGDDDGETTATTIPVTIGNNPANKLNKGGNRIRSYIPYKQDLVGVFANVNGLSRNLHPF